MSNAIITNADVKKFLALANAGLKKGKRKEMDVYTSRDLQGEGEYYVRISFSFMVAEEVLDEAFVDEDLDATNDINDLLKGL